MRYVWGVFLLLVGYSAHAELANVSNSGLQGLIEKGVPIVDVRRADEWAATGVVAGSHKITFFDQNGDYDAKKWLAELNSIAGKDQPVVLICESGVRSKVVANWLSKGLGYSEVYNVTSGISGWIGEDKPVVRE
ncbi:MAG: rhodanese-like domain-containing protein [Gammaproteobacteria bacterium]|nr:rhodanese-like domain-containing protein [Gammaproteobacteria bacterium]